MKSNKTAIIFSLLCVAACGIYLYLAWKDKSIAMAIFGCCFLVLAWYFNSHRDR